MSPGEQTRDFYRQQGYTLGYNDGLAHGRLEGEQESEERIIKLLEAQCERPLDPKWEHYRETCSCWQIALIKGEK